MNRFYTLLIAGSVLTACTSLVPISTKDINTLNSGPVETALAPNNMNEFELLNQVPEEIRDLTIPYLRNRSYPGSSIEIISTFSNTLAYSSYLSSYQSDGLKIYALLTKPESEIPPGGYPAVVFIHGYIPPRQYSTTQRYADYVDYLAKNGVVVFKIDLRGHANSEGEPSGAYYSSDYIVDTLNAYESLKTLDYVNTGRIGLWGHSMAGNVVFRSLVVKPEIPVGVIWSGAVYTYQDMQDYGIQDSSYQPNQNPNRNRRQRLRDLMGEIQPNNPFWQAFVPTNFAHELKGRIQLHHATNDPVVSVEYSRNLVKLLDEAEVSNQFFEYPSGGHNLEGAAFIQAMERTVDILNPT